MNMLEADDLHVAYGPIAALSGVSVRVARGELVTVIGANGAGKSTLLRTLAGLIRPVAGKIRFDGKETAGLPTSAMVKRGLAMVPEGRHVFPDMTVSENLDLGAYYQRDAGAIRDDRARVLALFPILQEKLRVNAGRLSGGQQQMLAIGRALMSRPCLLLLDEPSLGLAPVIVQQLGTILRDLNRAGTTILLVEQNARMALRLADRGYILANGRIAGTGTGQELLMDPAVQRTYLGNLAT